MAASEEAGGVAPQNKGSWMTFMKSISNFNGDLSSLTAPPFILGTISLTEFSAYWTEHPSVFVAPSLEKDPAKRALLVLKWFLTSLKQSYCSRSDKLGSEKKPLNPFLGELYIGKWDDESGTTTLVSEQVSHHPPVTAYCIRNEKHGVTLQGYNGQKASFSRTIQVRQVGHGVLHLAPFNETYMFTLPHIHIEGLIYGSPFVELSKSTYIVSSSGFVSRIDYAGKGWMSGKKNSFHAVLYPEGKEKDILYSADGQWNEQFVLKKGEGKKADVIDEWVASKYKTTPFTTRPVAQQGPLEAKVAWGPTMEAIKRGDMDTVHREKSKIEISQRELRKKEKEEGREWQRRYFSRVESDPLADKLLTKNTGEGIEPDKTGGIWRFDEAKARAVDDTPPAKAT